MNPVRTFCRERKIPEAIEEAFIAFCKVHMRELYGISMLDTISLVGDKIKPEEVKDLWNKFIIEMRDAILSEYHVP